MKRGVLVAEAFGYVGQHEARTDRIDEGLATPRKLARQGVPRWRRGSIPAARASVVPSRLLYLRGTGCDSKVHRPERRLFGLGGRFDLDLDLGLEIASP